MSSSGPLASPAPASSTSSSRHSRVVACEPVPKAWPGSITRSIRSRRAAGSCQGGRTYSVPATSAGRWKERQRESQSSAISLVETATRAPPTLACSAGSVGSSPGGAVEHVLDGVAVGLDLLDAGGREREQLGERGVGVGARDANREADHWWWCGRRARRSLENIDSSWWRFSGVIVSANSCQQLALGVAQPPRDLHVDDDAQVAVTVALQPRHALAAQDDHLAGLGAGLDLDGRRLRRASAPRSSRRAPRAAPARRAR